MTYYEKARELPVLAKVDVLVCGGGPAGVGAAIRAGRLGAKTMVVEAGNCLGGVATAGLMSNWGGRSSSELLPEIYRRTAEKAETLGYAEENHAIVTAINHEIQKIVLQEMALEAGVEILFCTWVCGAVMDEDRIAGVIVENKSGRSVILAKCVVDSTGDGDVAAHAGVPYWKGRESDGKMQPCTLMFQVGGVDYSRAVFPGSFETLVPTPKGELQALARQKLPFPAGHVLLYQQPLEGVVCCNMTNCIEVDGTDAVSLTKGITVCRSQIEPIVKFLREYAPGYERCWLLTSGSLLGVRETRHFQGRQRLEREDILSARHFDDWVVPLAYFNFDVHNLTGPSLDKTGIQSRWQQPEGYTIPYGCLLPEKVEGLLLSGRNICGSHIAHSNFRIMSVCLALGEAAGVAAALSASSGTKLHEIDVKKIQRIVCPPQV